jgi:hypothetical protein
MVTLRRFQEPLPQVPVRHRLFAGPRFGGYGFGEGYEEGLEEGFEGDFGGGDFGGGDF